MSSEAWEEIGPALLGSVGKCAPGYGETLEREDPLLYSRIDTDAKDNGISSDMLKQVAARAQGEMILAMNVYGQPRSERATNKKKPLADAQPASIRGRGGRGGQSLRPTEPADDRALDVELQLYSVQAKDVIARVQMRYTGSSSEEAMQKLAEKLRTMVANPSWTGWKWADPTTAPAVAPPPAEVPTPRP